MYATLLDDPEMINRQLGRYLAVGKAEIQAAAAEVLRPENRVVLTYMPAAGAGDGAIGGAPDEETAA
jgi:hypothetical protein